jgi:hypothetical protein
MLKKQLKQRVFLHLNRNKSRIARKDRARRRRVLILERKEEK